MKRKQRNPEKFDPLELFTAIGRNVGYSLDGDGDIPDFLDRVDKSLKLSIANPNMIYGKRVEAMFAHVAGALGRCRLIKQEDAGAVFVNECDLEIPDYRLILNDGTALLVEVKNFRQKDITDTFTVNAAYLSRLETYAALNGLPVKLAVYFQAVNTWVLLSRRAFNADGDVLRINFMEAIVRNEMSLLGERMIATLNDLCIELVGDPDECSIPNSNGEVVLTTRGVRVVCREKEVTDNVGKAIALYLVRYGKWIEQAAEAIVREDKVVGMRFVFAPFEVEENQDPQTIGTLSSMVSNAYRELTTRDGAVVALDVKHDPDVFSLGIPEDYKGSLPIWQFILEPNFDLRAQGYDLDQRVA